MAEIVNLRRFRKSRDRAAAEKVAEINRATFGRTRVERETSEADVDRAARRLDGHRLGPLGPADPQTEPSGD